MLKVDNNKIVRGSSNKTDKLIKNLFKFKKLKNNKFKNLTCIRAIEKSLFLTFGVKKTVNFSR